MATIAEPRARSTAGAVGRWAAGLRLQRDLLYALVQRDLKVRYKQSVMGFLWAILMPALIVGAGLAVKVAMAKLSGGHLSMDGRALVTVKSVLWSFFVSSIKGSSMSLISNRNLVTKIYTPREVFPLAVILSAFADFLVGAAVVSIILPLFMGVHFGIRMLLVPVFLAELVLLVAAIGLFLSAASLFFRDVKYLVDVFVTFAIFFTPVFYEATTFRAWSTLLLLNPVAPILEGTGAAVAGTDFVATGWFIYSGVFAAVGFVLALVAFKRMEPYFAESV